MVFAFFTVTVLVYALAQPAFAVAYGNNLLRPQLLISLVSGGLCFLMMLLLVPTLRG